MGFFIFFMGYGMFFNYRAANLNEDKFIYNCDGGYTRYKAKC